MKFLCPSCKAKYQISDEKIVGRTLKMDCRRCSHAIVIRGDKLASPEPARRRSVGPGSSTSRRRPSSIGPAGARKSRGLGADFRNSSASLRLPDRRAPEHNSALDQWHVSIKDVPAGPFTREEVGQKISTGLVDGESLVWRDGLDDWRPLKEMPALSALLRHHVPPPKRPIPPPPRGGGRPRTGPTRPVRPRTGPNRPAARPATGSRPQASSSSRGNVVPIGAGRGAAPDLISFEDAELDDEETKVGAVDLSLFEAVPVPTPSPAEAPAITPLGAPIAVSPPPAESAPRPDETAKSVSEPSASGDIEAELIAPQAAQPEPAQPEPAQPEPAQPELIAPGAALPEPIAPGPGASALSPPTGAAGTAPDSVAAMPAQAPVAAPAPDLHPSFESLPPRRRRALPVGAWIAIAGAIAFGMTLAVVVGVKLVAQPTPVAITVPAPVPALVPEPTPATDPLEIPPEVAEAETAEVAAEENPEETAPEEVQVAVRSGSGNARVSRPATGTRSATPTAEATATHTNTGPRLSAAERARLAAFEEDHVGIAQINTGHSKVLNERSQRSAGGSSLDSAQLSRVVSRHRSEATRCYETAVRQSGQSPTIRYNVNILIGGSGTVTRVNAQGPNFGNMKQCLERTIRRWRFPRSGGETETVLPFVIQGDE